MGASLNFEAGTVERAPMVIRKMGFEWAWRIKEEPYLWRRYWNDGTAFLRLVVSRALPLLKYRLATRSMAKAPLNIEVTSQDDYIIMKFGGAAVRENVQRALPVLRRALAGSQHLVVDLSETGVIDSRFLGLLLVVRKLAKEKKTALIVTGASSELARVFRLSGVDFLLKEGT
jgi:N-acetylglucosaminyldiphosphoundecaprenol N-acetyl-beta-D-mannosaminyltransferase